MGGNENESWKEEIYYTCMSERGVHQMPLKAQGEHKVLVRLQKIGGKEKIKGKQDMLETQKHQE